MNIIIKSEFHSITYAGVILEVGDYIGLHHIVESKLEHEHLNGYDIQAYTKRK